MVSIVRQGLLAFSTPSTMRGDQFLILRMVLNWDLRLRKLITGIEFPETFKRPSKILIKEYLICKEDNLELNPKRHTGYIGSSTRTIWDAVYYEKCSKYYHLDENANQYPEFHPLPQSSWLSDGESIYCSRSSSLMSYLLLSPSLRGSLSLLLV
ncbi:hypothetical protein Cgig2_024196 [Carnegiea gigantea]|uniref:Uncharacterized protein n=1 Tax=Carnegiea gigantea TaxID=171969 RepID=A0A9Q1KH67_9CARY|nr:hypothetical protein Cgig2_024196 [Carnegiea gigantea]